MKHETTAVPFLIAAGIPPDLEATLHRAPPAARALIIAEAVKLLAVDPDAEVDGAYKFLEILRPLIYDQTSGATLGELLTHQPNFGEPPRTLREVLHLVSTAGSEECQLVRRADEIAARLAKLRGQTGPRPV